MSKRRVTKVTRVRARTHAQGHTIFFARMTQPLENVLAKYVSPLVNSLEL